MIWQCPKCKSVLVVQANSLICSEGHTYDKAKQGYVNLLLANQKNSREPGDNEEMMSARRGFLRAGHYGPLVDAIFSELTASLIGQNQQFSTVLDLGCGEGYYLESLFEKLQFDDIGAVELYGLDISKVAIRKAASSAKQLRNRFGGGTNSVLEYAVASSADVPVHTHSVDVVLTVFAPVNASDLTRILKPNGVFIRVVPGPRHLYQLRSMIYQNVHLHEKLKLETGFVLDRELSVQYAMPLGNSMDREQLLEMTPFNWQGREDVKQLFVTMGDIDIDIEADFLIQVSRPQN